MTEIQYESNNSGGGWWLSDEDWRKMEAGGWKVRWLKDEPEDSIYGRSVDDKGRWLGALAMTATKDFEGEDPMGLAEIDFAHLTGQDLDDKGCPCCGPPHYFCISI